MATEPTREPTTEPSTEPTTEPTTRPPVEPALGEREFLRVVGRVRRIADPAFLDLPLEQAPFDSLELLALRAALETELDCELSDERFLPKTTLRDLYRQVAAAVGRGA